MNAHRIIFLAVSCALMTACGAAQCVSVKDMGAVGDGKHDDRAAIQKALDTGGCVNFPAGTYKVGSYDQKIVLDGHYALELKSHNDLEGTTGAKIVLADGFVTSSPSVRGGNLMHGKDQDSITIRNLTFDLNGAKNLVPAGRVLTAYALLLQNTSHVTIDKVTIVNSPGRNMVVAHGGSYIRISNSTFRNGGTSLAGNHQNDYSAIYLNCDNCSATHNTITNDTVPFTFSGGIELHGSHTLAADNVIEHSLPGVYVVNENATPPREDLSVLRNTISKCGKGVVIMGPGLLSDVHIDNNAISTMRFPEMKELSYAIEQNRSKTTGTAATEPGLVDSTITGNQFTDLDETQPNGRTFFMSLNSAKSVSVTYNRIGAISGIPFLFQSSAAGLHDITVTDNSISDFGNNSGRNYHFAFFVDMKAGEATGGKSGTVSGLQLSGNTISVSRPAPEDALISGEWEAGAVRGLSISGNTVRGVQKVGAGTHAAEIQALTRP